MLYLQQVAWFRPHNGVRTVALKGDDELVHKGGWKKKIVEMKWSLSQPKSQRDDKSKNKFCKKGFGVATIVIIGNYGKP